MKSLTGKRRLGAFVLALVLCLAALCPAAFAAAQLPSLPASARVVDDAGVLSESTVQSVEQLNIQLQEQCEGAQIGVLTVQYTGNVSTEEYALEALNTWGVGSADKNNGVLILLVMESPNYADGDYYISTGIGFRNTTLETQASAIAQTMEDDFAAQNYDAAVLTCTQNVANTIAEIYGVTLSDTAGGGEYYYEEARGIDWAALIEGIVIFAILAVIVLDIIVGIGRSLGLAMLWGPFGWFRPRPPRPPRGPRPYYERRPRYDDRDRRGPRGPRGGGMGDGGSFHGGGRSGGSPGSMGGGRGMGGGGGRGR